MRCRWHSVGSWGRMRQCAVTHGACGPVRVGADVLWRVIIGDESLLSQSSQLRPAGRGLVCDLFRNQVRSGKPHPCTGPISDAWKMPAVTNAVWPVVSSSGAGGGFFDLFLFFILYFLLFFIPHFSFFILYSLFFILYSLFYYSLFFIFYFYLLFFVFCSSLFYFILFYLFINFFAPKRSRRIGRWEDGESRETDDGERWRDGAPRLLYLCCLFVSSSHCDFVPP